MFPRTDKKTLGYSLKEVEEFLKIARRAFDTPEPFVPDSASLAASADTPGADRVMTAADIRHTAFSMQKGGYVPAQVDAAMERLEDAFADRDRDRDALLHGEKAWAENIRVTSAEILARLQRGPGKRFSRASFLSVGYRRADVDRLAAKLVKHFEGGRSVSLDEVRTAVFRPERGGYREAQVDLVLDSVVEVMLAIR